MMCCLVATSPQKNGVKQAESLNLHQEVDLRNHKRWSLTVPYHIQRCLEMMRGPSFGSCKRILRSCHRGMENPGKIWQCVKTLVPGWYPKLVYGCLFPPKHGNTIGFDPSPYV